MPPPRADARLRDMLQGLSFLSPEARETLGGAVDHQFVEHADRNLVIGALVDHQHTIDGARSDTDFLRFALGANFLITSRRAPLHSTQAARRQLEEGRIAATPIDLFDTIVGNICDCSAHMMREIAAGLDEIEDNVIIEGRGRDQRGKLGGARRKVVRLAR